MSQENPEGARPAIASAIIAHDGKVLLVKRRVKEGSLSWQFPGGEVEHGESAGQAATREVREETGLVVAESKILGERVHPNTGRMMVYVACDVVEGDARIVDDDELVDFAWAAHDELGKYIPYGFYEPVQEHLDEVLTLG